MFSTDALDLDADAMDAVGKLIAFFLPVFFSCIVRQLVYMFIRKNS